MQMENNIGKNIIGLAYNTTVKKSPSQFCVPKTIYQLHIYH